MQNDLNEPVSEIISTYVYKIGLQSAQYSYSAAISFFNTANQLRNAAHGKYVCAQAGRHQPVVRPAMKSQEVNQI